MVEPEVVYVGLDDVMNLAEDLVVSVVARVLDKRRHEFYRHRARHHEARVGSETVPARQG